MPKETSPFAAHEFDAPVEHIVLGEDDPVMTETGVHRLLDTPQGAILLAEGCDEGLRELCSNLASGGQIESLAIEQLAPRLTRGGAAVLVADAVSLGRQPDLLLSRWRYADPTVVIIVTGSKQDREALLAEMSAGLLHRFLVVPTSVGQTRLVLASALKRHEELRRSGPAIALPIETAMEASAFPIKPVAIAAVVALLGVILAWWWLGRAPSVGPTEPSSTAVVDVNEPAAEGSPAGPAEVDGLVTAGTNELAEQSGEQPGVDVTAPETGDLELAQQALADDQLVGDAGAIPLFKAVLESAPTNAAAQEGLAAAEQMLLDRIALALVEGRVDDAEFALADLAYASPDQPRLPALEAEIRDARADPVVTATSPQRAVATIPQVVKPDLAPLRARVRQRIADAQLLVPAGDSARFHLDALSEAGDDAGVIAALEASLRSTALDQVSAALAAGDLEQAEQRLVTATLVSANRARLAELQATITGTQQRAILDRANAALRANRVSAPPGDNAVEWLMTLTDQRANLPGLDTLLETVSRRLSLDAEAAFAQQDIEGAATAINSISTLWPQSAVLVPLQSQLRYSQRQQELLAEVVSASTLTLLSYDPPVYPRSAQRRGTEGWVEVEFIVTTSGTPTDIVVVAGEPAGVFDDSALKALSSAEFEPYTEADDIFARRVQMRVRFNFDN